MVNGGGSADFKMPKKSRKGRIIAGSIVAVLVVILAVVGVYGFNLYNSAKSLKTTAKTVVADAKSIESAILSNDYDKACSSASDMSANSKKMNEELSSTLWQIASVVPVVSEDVNNVKALASTLQDASDNAIVPLTSALKETPLNTVITSDGTFNTTALNTLLSKVESTAPIMQRCADTLNNMSGFHFSQIDSLVGDAKSKIISVNDSFQAAAALAPIASTLLGSDGERTYLIVPMQNAETRCIGGFPGSSGTVTISNGKITLGDFLEIDSVIGRETLPDGIEPTEEELNLYKIFITQAADCSYSFDFPRVADIWKTAACQKLGVDIDGVIALTPAVLQSALKVVGSVKLSDGTELNGDNATKVLSSEMYWKYLPQGGKLKDATAGNEYTDGLFSEAAKGSFSALLSHMNSKNLMKLVNNMMGMIDNRNLMIWLSDEDEQETLSSLNCSGELSTDQTKPVLGVYFSIRPSAKMGWYLDANTVITPTSTTVAGATYQVTTVLTNTMTEDELDSAPGFVAGFTDDEHENPGNIAPFIYLVAPAGGTISNISAENEDGSFGMIDGTYNGFQVEYIRSYFDNMNLNPGETCTITYDVTVSPSATTALTLATTPTLTEYR